MADTRRCVLCLIIIVQASVDPVASLPRRPQTALCPFFTYKSQDRLGLSLIRAAEKTEEVGRCSPAFLMMAKMLSILLWNCSHQPR